MTVIVIKNNFMTNEQIQAKTNEKVEAVKTLCGQLQVVITAEQMITPQGFIKQVVYYNDIEKYDVDEELLNKKTNEEPNKEPSAEVQSKDSKVGDGVRDDSVGDSKGDKDKADTGDSK